jgi:hypothetical protein
MITAKEAQEQADALDLAAKSSPVRQYRYELARRGREWSRCATALSDLEESGDEGVIELAGSLTTGMQVFHEHELGNWAPLIRTLQNGGQFSLHFDDRMGQQRQGVYRNLFGPSSPVVVRP